MPGGEVAEALAHGRTRPAARPRPGPAPRGAPRRPARRPGPGPTRARSVRRRAPRRPTGTAASGLSTVAIPAPTTTASSQSRTASSGREAPRRPGPARPRAGRVRSAGSRRTERGRNRRTRSSDGARRAAVINATDASTPEHDQRDRRSREPAVIERRRVATTQRPDRAGPTGTSSPSAAANSGRVSDRCRDRSCTSAIATIARAPLRPRSTCTTTSTAAATCSVIASNGKRDPLNSASVARRRSASTGPLACTVDSAPSWPVFKRLQQVERLGAAHLADDDAVGSHAQRGPHEIPHRHRAGAFRVRRAGLEPHHVRLHEPELRGLLDRDDALGRRRSLRTSRSAAWSCPSSSLPTRARSSRPRRPSAGTRRRAARARTPRARWRASRTVGSSRTRRRSRAAGSPRAAGSRPRGGHRPSATPDPAAARAER